MYEGLGNYNKRWSPLSKSTGIDIPNVHKLMYELYNRTPGYLCWQGENWAACCNDYCEYIVTVGIKKLEALGIADELFEPDGSFDGMDDVREFLVKDGGMCGYLFRCLHCGKYKLRVDMD